eukprot:scaffold1280_cov246-Pinguiococcus_pyrenoidosus.AAC.11
MIPAPAATAQSGGPGELHIGSENGVARIGRDGAIGTRHAPLQKRSGHVLPIPTLSPRRISSRGRRGAGANTRALGNGHRLDQRENLGHAVRRRQEILVLEQHRRNEREERIDLRNAHVCNRQQTGHGHRGNRVGTQERRSRAAWRLLLRDRQRSQRRHDSLSMQLVADLSEHVQGCTETPGVLGNATGLQRTSLADVETPQQPHSRVASERRGSCKLEPLGMLC